MSHTPGPWKVSGLDPHVIGPVRIMVMDGGEVPQQQAVARVMERTNQSPANARLIAAAPDMLAVLKDVQTYLESSPYATDCAVELQMVRAVIAKAEGK